MRANVVQLSQLSTPNDFKDYVDTFIGDLSGYFVLGDRVLIATYIPPEKTKGGIIRPGGAVGEERFTGNIGLVLKLGPKAFRFDGPYKWCEEGEEAENPKPKVGDWVQYEPTQAREFFLGPKGDCATGDSGISCRHLRSDFICAVVDEPNRVGRGQGFENL